MKKTVVINKFVIREICLEAGALFNSWDILIEDRDDMVLALDEALTNIYEHGYCKAKADNRFVSIEIIKGVKDTYIIISDFSKPFSIDNIKAPIKEAYLESEHVGGFGISIIKKIMNHVRLFRLFDENVLMMQKKIRYGKDDVSRISTETADAIIQDGILKVNTKPGSIIKLNDAKQQILSYMNLIEKYPEKKAFAMVINTKGMAMITEEARQYYTDLPAIGIKAIAIVVNSTFGRWLGNIFVKMNKRNHAIKLFNSDFEAMHWVSSFNDFANLDEAPSANGA